MSNGKDTVVPATLLSQIKEGLIKLGYATESTPLISIQDSYFKYVMVRQTGFNPSIPYAIGLLPKEIQDQLSGGGGEGGELGLKLPELSEMLALIASIKDGSWAVDSLLIPTPANVISPADAELIIQNGGSEIFVNSVGDGVINNINPTNISINKKIPILVEITGINDDIFDEMLAGTSDNSMYFAEYGVPWREIPQEMAGLVFRKHPTNGKYYLVFGVDQLFFNTTDNPSYVSVNSDGSDPIYVSALTMI